MAPYTLIRYEPAEEFVVRLVLDRPAKRNAQDAVMTYEIDRALTEAARDDGVKVVILSGAGDHFNSGHDQRQDPTDHSALDEHAVSQWAGYDLPGVEGQMTRNRELYFETTWRWRNFPKVLIGQVHGKAIGGALMLLSACDLIVASEDALFADPTVNMGVPGVEYLGHPWDLGPRKAKELLMTGDFLTARELEAAGFVNRVVPLAELPEATLALARRVAQKPTLGLKLAKEAVNAMQDAQGIHAHLKASFALTTLGQYQLVVGGGLAAKQATDGGLFTGAMQEPPAGTS
ncbi:MAG TPA: enoyl-CoA hydratase [Mycobacteriales bacterium]|jgi:enoyl-CoA hydratase|nr:enoyl-CoA hydratase [Mycobacteriales bacterium]